MAIPLDEIKVGAHVVNTTGVTYEVVYLSQIQVVLRSDKTGVLAVYGLVDAQGFLSLYTPPRVFYAAINKTTGNILLLGRTREDVERNHNKSIVEIVKLQEVEDE